ncbi:MAG TPA: hypothetical protein PLK77_00630 [Pyrinomonadaceae bacterium]|nr:hypothetical protein [Pyrinomonadaceae bacterium]
MPKKFDTNPLDPEFPEKAKAAAQNGPDVEAYRAPAESYGAPPASPYSTAEFPVRPTAPPSVTEDETQRFSEAQYNAYAFQGGQVPAAYQAAQASPFADMNRAGERKESKTGIPEKWLIGIPYIPFTIGLIAGIILLLVIPKEENKVRFHAAQGLAAHVGILIVTTILGIVGNVTDIAGVGSTIFTIVTTIMLLIFAIKAWSGKPVHIQAVDDLTNWLEEKIGPVKS